MIQLKELLYLPKSYLFLYLIFLYIGIIRIKELHIMSGARLQTLGKKSVRSQHNSCKVKPLRIDKYKLTEQKLRTLQSCPLCQFAFVFFIFSFSLKSSNLGIVFDRIEQTLIHYLIISETHFKSPE